MNTMSGVQLLADSPERFVSDIFTKGMSDDVESGRECVAAGRAGARLGRMIGTV